MFHILRRVMGSVSNIYTTFNSCPAPVIWNFKWYFIVDTAFYSVHSLIIRIIPPKNDGFVLVTLDFARFDKLFFFCADSLQKDGSGFVGRVLGNELALNSFLKD